MTLTAADTQSVMNALTIVSAEQQTMNYYLNRGNRPTAPRAHAMYWEIARMQEQQSSHYETLLNPLVSWLTHLVANDKTALLYYRHISNTEASKNKQQQR